MDNKQQQKKSLPYNNFEFKNPEEILIKTSKLLFERFLTDSCGGNMSLRHEGKIYITPRFSAEYFHWDIPAEKVSIFDEENNLVRGNMEEVSRESKLHLLIYKTFREINSVLHVHPPNIIAWFINHNVLIAETQMMANRGNSKMLECNPENLDQSEAQNNDIIELFKKSLQPGKPMSLAVAMKNHGAIVASENIFKAVSLLESIEVNAKAMLFNEIFKKMQ